MRLETGQAVETVAIAVEVNRHPHKPDNHIKRNNHRQRIHHQRVVKIKMKKIFETPHRAARRAGVAGKIVKNTYSAVSRRIVVGRIAKCKIRHQNHNHKNTRPVPIPQRRGTLSNRNERT